MLKFIVFLLCAYFLCVCEPLYTTHLGIFVEEENLHIYQDLTNRFVNQTVQTTVSLSVNFYNETEPLVLDDKYITTDLVYDATTTENTILVNVQQHPSKALCHIAEWTNTTFVTIFPDKEEGCLHPYYLQPNVQEYLQIALSLFKMSDNENREIILLINSNFAVDSSIFLGDNDTLYSVRLYNLTNSTLESSLYTILTDGTTDRIIAIGAYQQIHDVLAIANQTTNLRSDQWIVAPIDSYTCPENITMFSFVCILHSYQNSTSYTEVDSFIYDQYLRQLWNAVNTFVSNSLHLIQTFNDYLLTLNSSNTSTKLNVIKYNHSEGTVSESMIGYWTRNNGLYTTETAFDAVTSNKLTVVLIHEPPFISRIETNEGVTYEGYTIDILNEIAKRMDFEYTVYTVPDGEYGVLRPDGTWSGIIGEVAKGAADIGIGPISVTAERETVIDFTAPYYDFAGLQLLMRDPTVYNDMFAFASAFTGIVWITWFTIQFSTAVILYVFHRLQLKSFSAKPQHNPFNFKECVWFVMGSITLAGADRSPITFSSRILVAGFWFFCQIMMGTYTANLAAFMTSSRLSYSIESLDDLSTQTSITYSVMKGTVGETYFNRMATIERNFYDLWKEMSYESDILGTFAVWEYPLGEKYTKIWNAIQATGLIHSSEEGFKKLMGENFAFIHETPMIKYQMNKQCGFLTIGSPFSSKPYALVLQQNSPLLDSISKTILQMQSETIITELKDKWWKNGTVSCPTTEGNQGLAMDAVGGIFIVMAVGCGISFLMLLMELIWTKYKKSKISDSVVKLNDEKIEMKETKGSKDDEILSVSKVMEEDNLSVIDLSKYGYT